MTRPISAHEAVTRPHRVAGTPERARPPVRRPPLPRIVRHALVWTCQLAALAAYVAGVYLAVAVGLGTLTSWSAGWVTATRLAAVALTAAGFPLVRRRVSALTRRILLPAPSRYEVLASVAGRLRTAGPIEEALPSLARLLGEGTEAREAAVWLRSGRGLVRAAGWSRSAEPTGSPAFAGAAELGEREDIDVFATVRDSGELLGALSIALAPGRDPALADVRLVTDLANAAGSLMRSTLLTAELSARLSTVSQQAQELHSSRRRLVLARDTARRRLVHELAVSVQSALAAIRADLAAAAASARDAGADADALRQAAARAQAVVAAAREQAGALVAAFRSVVHGVYPAALSDYGLATAIEGLAEVLPRPTRIAARRLGRYPMQLESAIYFCAAVALRALAAGEHAVPLRLTLAESGSSLILTVIDDARPGELHEDERGLLEEMGDHAGALGGSVTATEIGGQLWLQAAIPLPDPAAQPGAGAPSGPDSGTGPGTGPAVYPGTAAGAAPDAGRAARSDAFSGTDPDPVLFVGWGPDSDLGTDFGIPGPGTGPAPGSGPAASLSPFPDWGPDSDLDLGFAPGLRHSSGRGASPGPCTASDPGAGSGPGADQRARPRPEPGSAPETGPEAGEAPRRRAWRAAGDAAFWAGFALYSAFAAAWLGLGLVTAVAANVKGAHDLAVRLAHGGHPAWLADVANGVVAGLARSYPAGEVALDYAFSALNIAIAIALLRLARRDWTVRLLAVGMIGSAGAFNLQAHSDIEAVQRMTGLGIGWWHSLLLHGLGGVAYVFALLLFPAGRVRLARRSWWAGGTLALAGVAGAVALLSVSTAQYPHTVSFVVFFGLLTPVVGIVVQWRNYADAASAQERQQSSILLRALVFAFGAAVLLSAGGLVVRLAQVPGFTADSQSLVFWLFRALFAVIPCALLAGAARFRLWDVERLFSRALVYGLLALLVGLLYVAIVVGADIELNLPMRQNPLVQVGATAAVLLVLTPARTALSRLADRLAYGRRPAPDEVLSRLSALTRAASSGAEALPFLARVVGEGLGARSCEVLLARPDGDPEVTAWHAYDPPPADARSAGSVLAVPVVYRGADVGEIRVEPPPGGLAPDQRLLLAHLADGGGPLLHNAQLTAELEQRVAVISEQADRIAASRQRIAAAQAQERQALERNLHDAAQPQLTAVSLALGLAAHRVAAAADGAPDAAAGLAAALGSVICRLDDAGASLSEIARGLYPARLREEGLRAALEAHVRALPGETALEFRDRTGGARFPAEIEAAVCFACLEALQNAGKHAPGAAVRLFLSLDGGALRFAIADTGPGIDSDAPQGLGRQSMEDRIAAVGGGLEVRSRPGGGTTVSGWVPAEPLPASVAVTIGPGGESAEAGGDAAS